MPEPAKLNLGSKFARDCADPEAIDAARPSRSSSRTVVSVSSASSSSDANAQSPVTKKEALVHAAMMRRR